MTGPTRPELVRAAEGILEAAAAREPLLAGARIVGIGWATVELDRAGSELAAVGGGGWLQAERDELLGAASRRAAVQAGAPVSPPELVLLEPDTEGRLAASLVRFDEGVAAVYVRTGAPLAGAAPEGGGPLGRGRLAASTSRWGPHVIVLDSPPEPPA
jgi:hypothetical protein